ncbi:hypothetical protein ABW21_db0207197 [Orbilia brochopaga]|nr:hypothetical protein ABW21_db0207197 [Drechslerella brochopaga]
MGTIPAQSFLHRLTASAQRRRFEWALSEQNRGESSYEQDSENELEQSDGSENHDDSVPLVFQPEDEDTGGNLNLTGASPQHGDTSAFYPIKDVTGTPHRERASFYYGREEIPTPLTGIFTSSPQTDFTGDTLDDQRLDSKSAAGADTPAPIRSQAGKKVRFDDVLKTSSVETSPVRPDYASTIPPNIRISVSTKLFPNHIEYEVESEHMETPLLDKALEELTNEEYDDYDDLLSTDASEGSSAADRPRSPKEALAEILRRLKGLESEASVSSSGVEIEYGGIRLKEHGSSPSEDYDSDIQNALLQATETGEEENECLSPSVPDGDDGLSCQTTSEYDEQDETEEAEHVDTFADALMQNLHANDSHSPSDSSASLDQKIVDIEAYRHIPLLDYYGVEVAEDAAARSLLPVQSKVGRMSLGMWPPKENVPKRRASFYAHVKNLDEEEFIPYTITQRQRIFGEFCNVGNTSLLYLQNARDAKNYLRSVDELAYLEGDDGNRELNEDVRRKLDYPLRDKAESLMCFVEKEEARLAQLHILKAQLDREQEAAATEGKEAESADDTSKESQNEWKNAFPVTPGWKPVKVGWKSDDGRLVCVQEGIIPRFELVKEPEFGPPLPLYVWSGAHVTDDLNMNIDLAFKVTRVESKWHETAAGMYLKSIDGDDGDDDDDEVVSNISDDSHASVSSSDSEVTWSNRLLNHRLMLTCNSVHGSNVDLTFDPEELDTPTLDGERNFAKLRFGRLRYRYPSHVRATRMFNEMSELVVIPPPTRKEKLTRKPCLKNTTSWLSSRRSRPKKVKRNASFQLTNEQQAKSGDEHHPRANGFSVKKNKLFRLEMTKEGIFEVLPSVRAKHTRLARFHKCVRISIFLPSLTSFVKPISDMDHAHAPVCMSDRYYPQILQIPHGTCLTKTASRRKAYLQNHLARFKLGLPTLHSSKQGHKVDHVVRDLLRYRDRGAADRIKSKCVKLDYEVSASERRRRRQVVKHPEGETVKINGTGEQYLLYAKPGEKLRSPDILWEDVDDNDDNDDNDRVEEEGEDEE